MHEQITFEEFRETQRYDLDGKAEGKPKKRRKADTEAQRALKRKALQDRFKVLITPFSEFMNPPEENVENSNKKLPS